PEPKAPDHSNTQELGELLFTEYVYPFELAGVILLVAIVAAITLTLRRRERAKSQRPSKQVRVDKKDRVRLVSMDSE
ncbi:MAG: NADH-quinone oxidoreductase subunit J, partial [Gammaproteobacteria bacterium]|nr:NADH-quinone oxidoreductase subunit J [Gammaproteobacteria bacterium]